MGGVKYIAKHDWKKIEAVVNEQAKDKELWFHTVTSGETYLQKELRRLHNLIEMACKGELANV